MDINTTLIFGVLAVLLLSAYNLYKTAKLAAFALFAAALMVVAYLVWRML